MLGVRLVAKRRGLIPAVQPVMDELMTQAGFRVSSQFRRPNLHPGAFAISDDFDEPLPDRFWLGEA